MTLNLKHPKISGEIAVQNAITEVAAMMGENVRLRRGCVVSTSSCGVVSTYLHTIPQPGSIIKLIVFHFLKMALFFSCTQSTQEQFMNTTSIFCDTLFA